MNDLQSDEELAFVVEDAKEQIIVPAIEKVLKGVDFDQVMVEQWTDTICESCMQGLVDLQKPFKYVGKFLIGGPRAGREHGRMSSHLGVLQGRLAFSLGPYVMDVRVNVDTRRVEWHYEGFTFFH